MVPNDNGRPRRITTPFGPRSLSRAQIEAHQTVEDCPHDRVVHKWTVLRDLTDARERLNLSAQTLTVLEALLTFHPETALVAGEAVGLVVFPSNATLCQRARGISEATLRRHLAGLVQAGLVIRRDSPNGKRYARRGDRGVVTHAYGFDLAPLVARAEELASLADLARAEASMVRVAHERLTLLRRDCAKLIHACAGTSAIPAQATFQDRYTAILARLPRRPSLLELTAAGDLLEQLAIAVGNALLGHHKTGKMTGNAAHNERHNQSSNTEPTDSEPASEMAQKESDPPNPDVDRQMVAAATVRMAYPLRFVLDTCPDIQAYAQNEIRTWNELIAVADRVRAAMGISPHAWREARTEMGEDTAAITVAAILQRVEQINSPGGYLRSLVERKKAGRYSLGPVLQALNRAKLGLRPARH